MKNRGAKSDSQENTLPHDRKYRGGKSYPIPVWNGILEHCERIGPALWEFLWLLDKITIEKDGKGIVLSGAPVKIERIAGDLGRCDRTVRSNLDRLQDKNYIKRTRTPYGFTIKVLNSRKFGIWRKKEIGNNCRSLPDRSAENYWRDRQESPVRSAVSCRNKEDKARNIAKNSAGAVTHSVAGAASSPNTPPKKDAAAARAFSAFGFDAPFGHSEFINAVLRRAGEINNGNIVEVMERVIVELGRKVPPQWYEAKHSLEQIAVENESAERATSPGNNSFSPEALRGHCAAAVVLFEAAAERHPTIAKGLRTIAGTLQDRISTACDATGVPDVEALEREINLLDAAVFVLLKTEAGDEFVQRIRREAQSQLRMYAKKMNAEQLAIVEAQYIQKRLLEAFSIPRLSLFYMT